jgi:hypothetical protein
MANKKDRLTNDLSKHVGLGQWAKAVQTLQSLIELEPTNTHYYLRMGDYSLKAGNKAAAIKFYYQAADMYVKAGFSVKGIATYKMILKIAPEETQATALMRAINSASSVAAAEHAPAEPKPPGAGGSIEMPPATSHAEPARPSDSGDMPMTLLSALAGESDVADAVPEMVPAGTRASGGKRAAATSGGKKNINHLFASFTQDEFGAIVDKLEPLEFMDGERIIAEGEEGGGMYLITRGAGKVVKDHNGRELELCELGEGEFFGEMSLLSGGLRSASVFAKGETEALRLKSADLIDVIKRYPRVESVLQQFSQAMKQKMRELP